jgi:hypothetical protein
MNTDFCYFCTQLPEFGIGAAPPMELGEFDDLLKSVAENSARYVRSCSFPLDPELKLPGGSAAARFHAFEENLRYEIACFRAAKSGQPIPARPRRLRVIEGLQAKIGSIAKFDPLEREKKLNEFRGAFLAEIAAAEPFSREAAACYRFRLAMSLREKTFQDPAGREVFRGTVDAIEQESIGGAEVPAEEKQHQNNSIKA